ncbi:hypothetical protein EWM64_g425 [Hericium alpestre]|uniref:NADH dehydrogenase [ubiquinone] 1 beta subcomplex subunit 11, mitochondrial n=1 Tax=Hericium alpestre TaxID=135208 RepID=A0A4Z0AA57_9AGAM|nr:hypothetical protein EWM64_g425 [Hericium alpestre]
MFRFDIEGDQNVVSPDVRRSGLGKALMQGLHGIGRRWGMQKIMLTVFKANEGAVKFYRATGFQVDPSSPGYVGEGEEAAGNEAEDARRVPLPNSDFVHVWLAHPHIPRACYFPDEQQPLPTHASLHNITARSALQCQRPASCKRFASHGAHFNEPTGHIFSEKPLPPGQKRVKEDWENIWYLGMFGTMGLATLLLYYKPDTSIQRWALKEAKERMEARGETVEYKPAAST